MKLLMNSTALVTVTTIISTIAQAGTVYVGNTLSSGGAADGSPPFVILGEYSPAGPLGSSTITLPAGTVQDVKFYGGNYDFTLYALSLVGSGPFPNEQTFHVAAAETFVGSASAGIQTLAVSGFSVAAGELLGFSGIGPFYPQSPNDAVNSDATYGTGVLSFAAVPPTLGQTLSVGVTTDPLATYDYIPDVFGNQGRTYSIGVDVSTTVPDSSSTLLIAPIMAMLAVMKRRCFTRV